jgi:hypothetical protein
MREMVPFRGTTVVKGWPERLAAAQHIATYAFRGQQLPRIRYGDETHDWGAQRGLLCHDCMAVAGEFHVPGCDVERCPKCEGQAMCCGCLDDDDESGAYLI